METEISKTQIDRLGDRLRKGNITDSDLRLLDEYRRSFTEAYNAVAETIRRQLNLEPTGRPAKSTISIAEKLRRESIRLTQIQDIAGCRLVVPEIADQEHVVASLAELFSDSTVMDRRQKPSHGYRAVHVIATMHKKPVEIQIRTDLQQLWAELSEKLSDLLDPAIKYGGGEDYIKELLTTSSSLNAQVENEELRLLPLRQKMERLASNVSSKIDLTDPRYQAIIDLQKEIESHQANLTLLREKVLAILRNANEFFSSLKEQ